ncbi:MAG: HAMP domain-containing protein, partial [Granulosicoccus sp.]|nr:HAMP domain-containing protein [Granulosicoccus sp.]
MTVYNSEQLNKRIKKGHSISRWLLLITVIGTALSFFLLVGTASSSSYRNLVNEANQSQSVISELLATQIAGGLRWKKQDVVTGALDAYVGAVKQNSLALARIYNGKGELWLEHIPESHSDSSITVDNRMVDNNVGTAETISKLNDDLFTVAVPIVSGRNKDQIGTLFTIWDMSRKQSAARQILINSAWLALLFLVLLSVSLWWTVRRLIGKPLNKITSQMELLARGDTNVDITGVGRKDEIGAIAQAVCVFKQDALEAQEIRVQQDAAEQEAEKQRLLAIKAQEEQQ